MINRKILFLTGPKKREAYILLSCTKNGELTAVDTQNNLSKRSQLN